MSNSGRDEGAGHLELAVDAFKVFVLAVPAMIYHLYLGFDGWAKKQHILVRAAITTVIGSGIMSIGIALFSIYVVNIGSQTVYVSGLRLRLLPVPLSIIIYSLILAVIFLLVYLYYINKDLNKIEERIDTIENGDDSLGN